MKHYRGKPLKGYKNEWVEGKAIINPTAASFLGFVDRDGNVIDPESPIKGENISGKIFIFPSAKGSTVGSYVLVDLSVRNRAPKGLIMKEPSTVVISGAIVAEIPLIYGVDDPFFNDVKTGDLIRMNVFLGQVDIL